MFEKYHSLMLAILQCIVTEITVCLFIYRFPILPFHYCCRPLKLCCGSDQPEHNAQACADRKAARAMLLQRKQLRAGEVYSVCVCVRLVCVLCVCGVCGVGVCLCVFGV